METLQLLAARLRSNPADDEAYQGLKAHYHAQGDLDSLVALITDWAQWVPDARAAGVAYVEAGDLLLARASDQERAEAFYVEALERDPFNFAAIEGVLALARAQHRNEEAAEFLNAQLAKLASLGATAKQLAFLRYRLAEVYDKLLERYPEALQHYRAAYEQDPGFLRAIYDARQLQLAAHDWQGAVELYELEVAAEPEAPRKAALLRELAVHHSTRLGSRDGAISALERAHALGLGDAKLSHELAKLLMKRADQHPTPSDCVRIADLLAGIAETLPPAEAIGYLETALRYAPQHEQALTQLERLSSDSEPLRIAAHWVAYLAASPYGRGAHRRRVELARAYASQGQLEDAVFCLGPAAEAGYAPAAELLDELRGGSRSQLAPIPDAPAAERRQLRPEFGSRPRTPPPFLAPAEARGAAGSNGVSAGASPGPEGSGLPGAPASAPASIQALRRQAADLIARYRQDEAAAVYEQLLQHDPLDREAFAFLDGFLRRKQQHERRTALLEQSASVPGLPERVRVARLREAAGTYEARLKDYDAALRCLQVLVELDAQSEDLRRDQRRLLERARRWDELAVLLERELDRSADPDVQLTILRRLAGLHREQRRDRSASADALGRLLRLRPDDRIARDQLTEDLLELGRYEDVAGLLEQKIDDALVRSQKLPALRQLAAVCRDKLRDVERTRAVYERILELTSRDTETLEQLARLDESAGDHSRVLETLERLVAASSGPAAAATLLRMSDIAETKLQDPERAIELLSRAPALAPQQPELARALVALLERHARHDQLVMLLRQQVPLEKSASAKAELHRRIAQLLSGELGDADGAAAVWEELLALKEDREALLALQERALERDEPEKLVQILGRLSALEPDPLDKRDLLFERAGLLAGRLRRPDQAIADLTRLLMEYDLDFEPGLTALRAAAQAADEYQGLAQVLERRLQRPLAKEAQLEHARELADLYQSQLVDQERAIASLLRWAEADVRNPEPRRQLHPLLSRARRYPELLTVLDELALLEGDASERRRAALEAAELADTELGDTAGAWQRLVPLVEQGLPAAVDAIVALAQKTDQQGALYSLLERTGQPDVLLALLRARLEGEESPGVRVEFLRRIATLLIEYKQDEAGAAEAYRSLLEVKEDADALRFLQSIAMRTDDAPALASVLQRLAALEEDPRERRALLFAYAQVLNGRLGRAAEAVPILLELSTKTPDDEAVVSELLRACEAAHEHATLALVLEAMLQREREPGSRESITKRLADVYEVELQDGAKAIVALKTWAEVAPTSAEPHRRLRPHLQAKGRNQELLQSLDALARLETDAQAKLDATLAAAELARSKLGDPQAAWQRLAPLLPSAQPRVDRALHLIAIETQRLDELYALLEQANRYGTLVEWLYQRVPHEPNRAVVMALYRRMGRNLAGPLDDEAAAETAWVKLLEISEDAEALNFIRGQALRRDDMELLSDCLRRLAALELDPREKRDLLYEHGHLLRARLDRPAEAVAVLRDVIERLDPEFEPALDELIEACRAANDERTLVWAFERVLELERDAERRAELGRQLAELYAHRLQDPDRAVAALRAWAEAAPADAEPHHRMVALLRGSDRRAELIAELDAIARLDVTARRAEAIVTAAELSLAMEDAAGAFSRLVSLVNTGDHAAEALLWRIAFANGRTDEVIALYETAARHDDLVSVLKDQAERTTEPSARAELYRRCARLLVSPLGDELAAAEAYREVLHFAEDEEALAFLRRRAIEQGDATELCDTLARLARLAGEPEQKRTLMLEEVTVLADRLQQPAAAIGVLRNLLSTVDPGFEPAIDRLIALSVASADHDGLALGLESRLGLLQTASARAAVAERLADIYEGKLQEEAKATIALRVWSEAAPELPAPHRRLRPMLERAGESEALLATLDALSARETSADARTEAALAAARVAFERLHDAEGAWKRISPLVLAGQPNAEAVARELAETTGTYRPLANLYVLRARKVASPQNPKSDWTKAAVIYERHLNEPREAFEAVVRAFALDTQDRELLGEIDRLGAAGGHWERIAHVYNRLVQQTLEDGAKVEFLARHAALLQQHDADPASVLERLMLVCRLAPQRSDLLLRAEALAQRASNHAELVWIYERLAQHAPDDAQRIGLLLKAARTADLGLKDREQAMRDLRGAVALTRREPGARAEIEQLARELDRERPELGEKDARIGLVNAHMTLAQQSTEPFGPELVRHAARLLREELGDEPACFDALKQGAALFPDDLELYDALEQAALATKRLDALDAHLARSVQRADSPEVKQALLRRRGHLLAEHLDRHAKAADVYRQLLLLDTRDEAAFDALVRSLRRAGRLQDLIKLFDERLAATDDGKQSVSLLRQKAKLWEVELKNRPSAVDTWHRILRMSPEDEEASAALQRLRGGEHRSA
jgi:tetratricopeptide (TPR) repeat protein